MRTNKINQMKTIVSNLEKNLSLDFETYVSLHLGVDSFGFNLKVETLRKKVLILVSTL